MSNCAGLAGSATAANRYVDVELVTQTSQLKRLANDHLCRFAPKKDIQRTIIDFDVTAAGL